MAEQNTQTFELQIATAIGEYDKGVMENFKICQEAFNKDLKDYKMKTEIHFEKLESDLKKRKQKVNNLAVQTAQNINLYSTINGGTKKSLDLKKKNMRKTTVDFTGKSQLFLRT